MPIADSLQQILDAKAAINASITNKGIDLSGAPDFLSYSTYIDAIPTIPPAIPFSNEINTGWLDLGTPTHFAGLVAIENNDTNYLALSVTGGGNYTVYWGDGTNNTYATGVTATHQYNFSTYDTSNTTLVTHKDRSYKQAVVTIEPTTQPTTINLNLRHSTALNVQTASMWLDILVPSNITTFTFSNATASSRNVDHKFVERVVLNSTALSSLAGTFAACSSLWSVQVDSVQVSSCASTFAGCVSLVYCPVIETSSVTSLASMFSGCVNLLGPVSSMVSYLLNGNTTTASMFANCYRLVKAPNMVNSFSTATATSMFQNCYSLTDVNGLTMSPSSCATMFQNCYSLVDLASQPSWDGLTVSGVVTSLFDGCVNLRTLPSGISTGFSTYTTCNLMFNNCRSLETLPSIDMPTCANFSSMFNGCTSLKTINIATGGTAAGTNFTSMFAGCSALETITGDLNTAAGTNFTSMFSGCVKLSTIPAIDTGLGVTFTSMFNGCTSLTTIPTLNTTTGTTFATMFSGCPSLASVVLSDCKYTVSVAGCRLSATALNALYTGLGTAAGAQTITVTTNFGNTADDPTIATAKGWTVTG